MSQRIPVIAVVGRPNVGKSTLFNRLIGKREAIVDDVPGVTRDRTFGDAEWAGKYFRVTDTGGYVPDSDDLFDTVVREQVEKAISESDRLIFLVDARDGVTAVDREVASILRRAGRDVILAVNKVDSENYEAQAAEFYELGLGEIYPISALNGRTLGDMLDALVEDFPEGEYEPDEKELRIAVVGRPNAGKSSLVNALLGEQRSVVTDIPGATRDKLDSTLKHNGEEITLVDTAGLRKRSRVKEQIEYFSNVRTFMAIAESTVSIVLVDAIEGFERQDQNVVEEAVRRRKGLIIAVNKWDAIEKDHTTAREWELEMRHKLGSIDYAPIVFVSALKKQRVFKLIDVAKRVHEERKKKIPTSELNDKLLPIIEATPPPASPSGREVKVKFVNQVGNAYPVFIFFANYPQHIPDAYVRFLEKAIRKEFGFEGVPFTISTRKK
ncbi:MAG: ribosome biogenesis GTPase Der [Ignavibacteriales bacterium]|nr:ribosome biogenesis GTPase Der [Ignavibacteriales bacterium]